MSESDPFPVNFKVIAGLCFGYICRRGHFQEQLCPGVTIPGVNFLMSVVVEISVIADINRLILIRYQVSYRTVYSTCRYESLKKTVYPSIMGTALRLVFDTFERLLFVLRCTNTVCLSTSVTPACTVACICAVQPCFILRIILQIKLWK